MRLNRTAALATLLWLTLMMTAQCADVTDPPDVDGVRTGMSKAEALAALRKSHPRDTPVEWYGGQVDMQGFVKVPRQQLAPHDVDIFTALVIENPPDSARHSCSVMDSRPSVQTRTEVLFTANPLDPRVVLVEKHEVNCGSRRVGVRETVAALRARYGAKVSSSANIDLEFNRFSGEASYLNAFLEWRSGVTGFVMQSMGTSVRLNGSGLPADIGNPGGGIAVHAILIAHPSDGNAVREQQLYLWDDDQMTHWLEDHNAVRIRMNQSDWGVADLGKPAVMQALTEAYQASVNSRKPVRSAPAAAVTPAAARMPEPVPVNPALAGRKPDAEAGFDKQPAAPIGISLSAEAVIPVGVTLIDLVPAQVASIGKVTYTEPRTLMLVDPWNCKSRTAAQPTVLPEDFPLCGKVVPVPDGVMDGAQAMPSLPDGTARNRHTVVRSFKVPFVKTVGMVNAGAKLYRVDPPTANANDLGYQFRDGARYTWFLADPAACVTRAGKVFDCSKPFALQDFLWHALS